MQAADRRELDSATGQPDLGPGPYGARVLGVYDGATGRCSEPLEFLSCLYNGEMRPVLVPQGDAGEYLPYRRASFGLETLELSRAGALPRGFGAMVSIKDYPAQTTPACWTTCCACRARWWSPRASASSTASRLLSG
jgi:type IV secretion system protein VirB4